MSINDVRKNFVFKKEVASHLEELAKIEGKSMTMFIQEMIEEKYKEIEKEKKLAAFHRGAGLLTGFFGEETIQEIMANRTDI